MRRFLFRMSWALAGLITAACSMPMSESTALQHHSPDAHDDHTGPLPIQLVALRRDAPPTERVAVLESVVRRKLDGTSAVDRPLLWGEVGSWACLESAMGMSAQFLDASIRAFDALGATPDVERAAKRAMSTSGSEADKVFLGEPHERALLCLYRGLLYLAVGDFGNAQACFRKGALEDYEAAGEWGAGDWFVLDFLAWQALERMNPAAARNLMRSIERRYPNQLALVDCEFYEHPIIVVCGLGPAPEKVLAGDAREVLGYRRGPSRLAGPIRLLVVGQGGEPRYSMHVVDDVYGQAIARGRRVMDDVNESRSAAADARNAGGHVVSAVGAATPLFGPLLQLLGEGLFESASEIDATADLRQLTAIPAAIAVWRGNADALPGDVLGVRILGADGQMIAAGRVSVPQKDHGVSVIIGTCPY